MFSKEIYQNRRRQLISNLENGVVLICGNEPSPIETFASHYPFKQNSVFLYYTGIKLLNVTLLIEIETGKEILFADDYSVEDQVWTGPVSPFMETAEKSGFSCVKKTSELKDTIKKYIRKGIFIHYPPTCKAETLLKLSLLLDIDANKINSRASLELVKRIIAQREFKTEEEIYEMELSLNVSHEIYMMMLNILRPGLIERELAGEMEKLLLSKGLSTSFSPIITKNGAYLHNLNNDNLIKAGDLVLIDTGVLSQEGYCSDITRTYPASGKFSVMQKAVYEIVLKMNEESILKAKPGVQYKEVHLNACRILVEGLKAVGIMKGCTEDSVNAGAHALFMPHGLGHMIGMDGHDMEVLGENNVGYDSKVKRSPQFGLSALRFARELKAGHTITVEPGIYFIPGLIDKWNKENKFREFINYTRLENYIDFGGIRIEDDILVTKTGSRVLGSKIIPKKVEDIETAMEK